jgi:hypothetical protein
MAGVLAMICAVVLRRGALLDESVESERVRLVARDCALVLMVSVCAYASTYACTADTILSYYAEAVGVLLCLFIFCFCTLFFLTTTPPHADYWHSMRAGNESFAILGLLQVYLSLTK